MGLTGKGWELSIKRLGMHQGPIESRTYGEYQFFVDGKKVDALHGFVCECPGPGENDKPSTPGNKKRIKEGTYEIWTHDDAGYKYRTVGYLHEPTKPEQIPRPGLLLIPTKPRTGILIHPGHPDAKNKNSLYLSSIGCLNLTKALGPKDMMDPWESRTRVIAMIDHLNSFAPASFVAGQSNRIANASVVIEGEPKNIFDAPAAVASTQPGQSG